MVPLQIRNFRLNRASRGDAAWLRDVVNREGGRFGTRARLGPDNELTLAWQGDGRGLRDEGGTQR
jgi:poly-gamma-glutamate synthesis protein (capsule biosynthesis protein)